MVDESGLSIPYGRDLDHPGVELSPEAVLGDHLACRFVCPTCGQLLTKKLWGEHRRPHFAHYMDAPYRNCPWRDDDGVRQDCTRSRTQAIDAAQNIRLFIQRKLHTQELALFGSVPPLSSEDIAKVTRGKLEGALHVEGTGTKNRLELVDLLPNGRAGFVELDPTATRFRIDIEPGELNNGGAWVSPGIRPGMTFIGSAEWGRLVASPRRVSSGMQVYSTISPGDAARLPSSEKYRLGRWEVLCHVADSAHLAALRTLLPNVDLDFEAVQVDVVSPLSVPPSDITLGRVRVPKGSEVLLSVGLPKDKDRSLEVFPIPFKGIGQVTIPSAGLGVPRFLRLSLDGSESRRILIHWPFETERDWILDFIVVDPPTSTSDFSMIDPVIGLSVDAGPLLNPLSHPKVATETKIDMKGFPVVPMVTLTAPKGFTVGLKGEFPGEDGKPFWVEEREPVEAASIEARVKGVFSRGCRTLEFGFGSLGQVTLVATAFFDEAVARQESLRRAERERAEAEAVKERARQIELEKTRSAEERRVRIEEMRSRVREALGSGSNPCPRHISNVFVIGLLGLPKETAKEDLIVWRHLVRRRGRANWTEQAEDSQEGAR